jgi:hypothetical protein
MSSPYTGVIIHGTIRSECHFETLRGNPWTVSELDDAFGNLYDYVRDDGFLARVGVHGNMKRHHKVYVTHLLNIFILETCRKGELECQEFMVDGGIDLSMVSQSTVIEMIIDEFILFLNNQKVKALTVNIFREFAEISASQMWNTFLLWYNDIVSILNDEGAANAASAVDKVSSNTEQEDISSLKDVDGILCSIVLDYAFEKMSHPHYKTYLQFWKNEKVNDEYIKFRILLGLLLPYMRFHVHDPYAPFSDMDIYIFNLINSFDNFNKVVGEFSLEKWCEGAPSNFISNVAQIKEKILDELSRNDIASLEQRANSLDEKWGFRYSVKCLCFDHKLAIIHEFASKINRKQCYSAQDVKDAFLDVFGRTSVENRLETIEQIAMQTPHDISNAVTIYDYDINIMDVHPDIFLKMLYDDGVSIGFDIREYVSMIISSEGRNEFSGLPDLPGKRPIWQKEQQLIYILSMLYKFLYSEFVQEESNEFGNEIKTMLIKDAVAFEKMTGMFTEDMTNVSFGLSHISKTLQLHKFTKIDDKVLPIKYVIYLIQKRRIEELAEFKLLMKDINVLHLIGYFGWILLSDQVSNSSTDANEFHLSNECKDLIERYILRIVEDDDVEEKYYYFNPNKSYTENFDKKQVMDTLKNLNHKGMTLNSILNTPSCNHGIGGNLVYLYLKTLNDLRKVINSKLCNEVDIPNYLDEGRLKPLAIFKRLSDGGNYIFGVNHYDSINSIFGEEVSFDHITKEKNYKQSVQYINLTNGQRRWCGKLKTNLYSDDVIDYTSYEGISFYRNRFYTTRLYFYPDEDFAEEVVYNFFRSSVREVAQFSHAINIFMQHREEHFRLFTRYTIDFSNMLHDYYEKHILDNRGNLSQEALKSPYIPSSDVELPSKDDTLDKYLEYLYSHLEQCFGYDGLNDFKKNFDKHIDVNSSVGRDFDNNLKRQSRLLYFYDMLGKNPEIYDRQVRKGEKPLYALLSKIENTSYGDALLEKLKNNDDSNKEVRVFKTFNEMIIRKAMMSKVLLKIMNPNFVNPLYIYQEEGASIKSLISSNAMAYFCYMNFDSLRPTPNETIDKLQIKCYLAYVQYAFLYALIDRQLIPAYMSMPQYSMLRPYFNLLRLESPITVCEHYADVFRGDANQQVLEPVLKKTIDKCQEVLQEMVNMFFVPSISATYNYNICSLMHYRGLITDLDPYRRDTNGVSALKEVIDDPSKDEHNVCNIYCNISDKDGAIFPNKKSTIYNRSAFMSEVMDMRLKSELLTTFTGTLVSSSHFMNKFYETETLPGNITNEQEEAMELLIINLRNGMFYQQLLDDASLQILIGIDDESLPQKDRFAKLCSAFFKLFSLLFTEESTNTDLETKLRNEKALLNTIVLVCIASYENKEKY